jgi:hypothetical protein
VSSNPFHRTISFSSGDSYTGRPAHGLHKTINMYISACMEILDIINPLVDSKQRISGGAAAVSARDVDC